MWLLQAFKKRLLNDQIKVFVSYCIRQNDIEPSYSYWLDQFANWFPQIRDAYDITDADEEHFLEDVSVIYPTHYQLKNARLAIENLRKYYLARGKNIVKRSSVGYKESTIMAKTGRPPHTQRNKELVELRAKDPQTWTYKALGERFNIHPTTAHELYEHWLPKHKQAIHRTK